MNAVEAFDETLKTVNKLRASYGSPKKAFARIQQLKKIVRDCPDDELREALEMACVKIGRLINNPYHIDSWIDLAGYARTGVMIIDEKERERNAAQQEKPK